MKLFSTLLAVAAMTCCADSVSFAQKAGDGQGKGNREKEKAGQRERRPGAAQGAKGPQGRGAQGRGKGRPGQGDLANNGQRRGFAGRGQGGAGQARGMSPVIMALDANRDGRISAEEITNAAVALRKLDRNKDGQLTADELRPQGSRGQGQRGQGGRDMARGQAGRGAGNAQGRGDMLARIMQMDKNKDGAISLEEAPERMKENFNRIDGNGDGVVDKAELEKMMQRINANGGGGRRPQGDRERSSSGGNQGGKTPKRPSKDDA